MGVYVDKMRTPFRGMLMSHMLADTPAELHEMAARIGVDKKHVQTSRTGVLHYDICQSKKQLALKAGAKEIGRREVVQLIRQKM